MTSCRSLHEVVHSRAAALAVFIYEVVVHSCAAALAAVVAVAVI
jgi:hypothetical protein